MTGRWKSLHGEALNYFINLSWASPVSVYKADLLLMARIFLRPLLSSQCRTSSQLCHAPGRERTGKWLLSSGRNIMAYWTLAHCWFIASAIIRLASHRLIDGWFSLFADGRQAVRRSTPVFHPAHPEREKDGATTINMPRQTIIWRTYQRRADGLMPNGNQHIPDHSMNKHVSFITTVIYPRKWSMQAQILL